ncbi:MAG TPA: hypothetical protein VF832_13050, partial [Longimicrobiales bacterium]
MVRWVRSGGSRSTSGHVGALGDCAGAEAGRLPSVPRPFRNSAQGTTIAPFTRCGAGSRAAGINPHLVAPMVSRDDIQRLIHRQDAGRKVVSLFLDMSVNSDNKRTYPVFLSKQKGRFAELDSDREGHHRVAIGEAFSRIERWIQDNFKEANKGLAIYAELGGSWIEGYELAVPLQNRLEISERPIIG